MGISMTSLSYRRIGGPSRRSSNLKGPRNVAVMSEITRFWTECVKLINMHSLHHLMVDDHLLAAETLVILANEDRGTGWPTVPRLAWFYLREASRQTTV